MDSARQLLDELMGRNRNLDPGARPKDTNWSDPEFCPFYLVKFCPHILFTNTKADLGACSRIHDDDIKAKFKAAEPSHKKKKVEDEFFHFCHQLINDVDRRIVKGKQRLSLMNAANNKAPDLAAKRQEELTALTNKIEGLMSQVEEAGMAGDVDKAQSLLEGCEKLKSERDALIAEIENPRANFQGDEKQMEVCEVCGAFLIVGDVQQRIDDHLCGKQHLGYLQVRKAIEMEEQMKEEEYERTRKAKRDDKSDSTDVLYKRRRSDRDEYRSRDKRDDFHRSDKRSSSKFGTSSSDRHRERYSGRRRSRSR